MITAGLATESDIAQAEVAQAHRDRVAAELQDWADDVASHAVDHLELVNRMVAAEGVGYGIWFAAKLDRHDTVREWLFDVCEAIR